VSLRRPRLSTVLVQLKPSPEELRYLLSSVS
jgi:hypothetical protein